MDIRGMGLVFQLEDPVTAKSPVWEEAVVLQVDLDPPFLDAGNLRRSQMSGVM